MSTPVLWVNIAWAEPRADLGAGISNPAVHYMLHAISLGLESCKCPNYSLGELWNQNVWE